MSQYDSRFQFHKVRLKVPSVRILLSKARFQFHKVRLKVYFTGTVTQIKPEFQFHKVRLKELTFKTNIRRDKVSIP